MILDFLPPQFYGFFVGFVIVALVTPVLSKLAIARGFVDQPDDDKGGRKNHDAPVPPIGGLIIFGVFMTLSLIKGAHIETTWPLFVALSLLLVTGAVDDYRGINAWIKFSVQFIAAALIVIPGGAALVHLDNIFGMGTLWLGVMSVPFSIISVVLFINAINLMDGLDGLAGGVSFVALLWLLIAATLAGVTFVGYPILLLMGVLAGFLFHNMRSPFNARAKLFLGDAGSMSLGLILAWFCIYLSKEPINAMPPISVAWIIALPIIDICAQFYRRVRAGRHPFSPDRGHFHHCFLDAGYSVGRATVMIVLISFILGGVGYLAVMIGVPQAVLTGLWIAMIVSHIVIARKPERYVRVLKSTLCRRAPPVMIVACALMLGSCQVQSLSIAQPVGSKAEDAQVSRTVRASKGASPLEAHMRARRQVDPKDTRRTHKYTRLVSFAGENPPKPARKPGSEKPSVFAKVYSAASQIQESVSDLAAVEKEQTPRPVEKPAPKDAVKPAAKPHVKKPKFAPPKTMITQRTQDGRADAAAENREQVEGFRLGRHPDKTRFVFDLSDKTQIESHRLSTDGRTLTLKLPKTVWGEIARKKSFKTDPLIESYSVSEFFGSVSVVITFKQPAKFLNWAYLPPNQMRGHRLYFDVATR